MDNSITQANQNDKQISKSIKRFFMRLLLFTGGGTGKAKKQALFKTLKMKKMLFTSDRLRKRNCGYPSAFSRCLFLSSPHLLLKTPFLRRYGKI